MPVLEARWFYRISGQEFGPVDHAALEALFAAGHLPEDGDVRRDGAEAWVKVGRFLNVAPVRAAGAEDFSSIDQFDLVSGDDAPAPRRRPHFWYYRVLGEEFGPLEFPALRDLVKQSVVTSNTPIRRETEDDWRLAHTESDLFEGIARPRGAKKSEKGGWVSPQRGVKLPPKSSGKPAPPAKPAEVDPLDYLMESPTSVAALGDTAIIEPRPRTPEPARPASPPPATSVPVSVSSPSPSWSAPASVPRPAPAKRSSAFEFPQPPAWALGTAAVVLLAGLGWFFVPLSGMKSMVRNRAQEQFQTAVTIYEAISDCESESEQTDTIRRTLPIVQEMRKELEGKASASDPKTQLLVKCYTELFPKLAESPPKERKANLEQILTSLRSYRTAT
jgi:hypothetical protein